MNTLDIVVLAILILGTVSGWRNGFVKSVCSFAGFIVGLIVAYMLYSVVGAFLAPTLGGNMSLACLIAFFLIWVAVPIGLGLAGDLLTGFLKAVPILGGLNSLAGALLGFIKYFLGVTCVMNVLLMAKVLSPDTVEYSFFAAMMKAFFESFVSSAYQSYNETVV